MSRSGPIGRYSRRARRVLRQGKPAANRVYYVAESGPHIIAFMRAGMYFRQACLAAGVSPETAHNWRRLGRLAVGQQDTTGMTATEDHVRFYEAVETALAQFEAEALATWVAEVQRGNWQAARDLLARRFPQRWGNTESREVQVKGAQQMELHLVWGDEGETYDAEPQQLPDAGPAGYLEPPPEEDADDLGAGI
jgi:hypothetical protein